ncbi:MAG: hypothetical protein KKA65_04110 [Nanoarchaeota archaeon]|nr:hypothetical protein [Nanoarchaeota archaeon]MBU4351772.1 hypothetical protein [Nanoarchaeota archaeon]MBU4456662.1 hypothetical protein [Nanoarchaeota archaeon]MCG2719456.1 hypothetical protein [Nanoarchaeota archaeon]
MREILFRPNKELIKLLCDKENIPILEHIIERDGKEFERLKQLKEKGLINLGEKVRKKEFKDICYEIKAEVDGLLDIQNTILPKTKQRTFFSNDLGLFLAYIATPALIKSGRLSDVLFMGLAITMVKLSMYNSSYHYIFKRIKITKQDKYLTKIIFAHEYTHFLQHKILNCDFQKHKMFTEGHAIGVEKTLVNLCSEPEQKDNFLYSELKQRFSGLKQAYYSLCDRLNVKCHESLLNIDKPFGNKLKRFFKRGSFLYHDAGNALFQIYEEIHGKDIYKQILQA